MAHIDRRPDRHKRWRVRYRDPMGRERSRSFIRKADADRFMATVQADLVRGDWTDPRLSKISVEEWSQRWLRTKSHLKPKTWPAIGQTSTLTSFRPSVRTSCAMSTTWPSRSGWRIWRLPVLGPPGYARRARY